MSTTRLNAVLRRFLLGAFSLIAFVGLAADDPTRNFDLPSDAGDKALRLFMEQSGIEVVFGTATAAQVRTKAVKGELPPRVAIERMLDGTGLAVTVNERSGAFMVARDPNGPRAERVPASARPAVDPGESVVKLDQFVVSTTQDRGYYSTNTEALRLNTELKKLPLPVTVLNKEYFDDLNRRELDDLLVFTAAINPDQDISNNGFAIRGMTASSGEGASRNNTGFRGYQDTAGIERVEILKGPAGIIYGLSQPGGRVNVIGLRARFQDSTSFRTQVERYGGFLAGVDVNRVYGNKLAARMNLQYRRIETDVTRTVDSRSVNFNVKYRPWSRTEFEIDYTQTKRDTYGSGGLGAYTLQVVNNNTANMGRIPLIELLGVPEDFYTGHETAVFTQDHYIPTLTWRQTWSDRFSTSLLVNHQWRTQHSIDYANTLRAADAVPRLDVTWENPIGDEIRSWDFQFQAVYEFETFGIKNKLSTYAAHNESYSDFIRFQDARIDANGAPIIGGNGQVQARVYTYPLTDVANFQPIAIPSELNLLRLVQKRFSNNFNQVANLLHQADIVTPIGEFSTLLGINYTRNGANGPEPDVAGFNINAAGVINNIFRNETRSDSLPSGGLVYSPKENLQIYGAITRSYPNLNIARNSFGDPLPLQQSRSGEIGVRTQLLNDTVTLTVAAYRITDQNRVVDNPALFNINTLDVNGNNPRDPGFNPNALQPNAPMGDRVAAGQFRSEGVEVDVNVQLSRNLVARFEYAYTDARVIADTDLALIGQRDGGAIRNTYTAVGKYTFSDGSLNGLTLGSALRFTSDRYLTQAMGNVIGVVRLWRPGAQRVDVFATYRFRVANKYNVKLQLNVDNLLKDERAVGMAPGTLQPYYFDTPVGWRLFAEVSF